MPYIDHDKRKQLTRLSIDTIVKNIMDLESGDLNFIISTLIWARWHAEPCYKTGNALVGVLECAKQELIRRHLNSYEDTKIKSNGDLDA